MKNNVAVIIPNWNGKKWLEICLNSLFKQTYHAFEIVVVDNGSTDDSISYIDQHFPQVKVVALRNNKGFAAAINAGVRSVKTDYVAFLNNDTKADPDWLNELMACAQRNPEIASFCSKLLNYDDRKKIDGVGIQINEVGQARSIGWEEKDVGQFEKERLIFGATGGAALFKREIFLKVGGFDEHYFMYSEEVDWAFRAQFLGYRSLYSPKAIIYHKHKATSGKRQDMLEYWQFKNMYMTIIKNFPTSILLSKWRWLKILLVYFNTIWYQFRSGFFWQPFAVTFSLLVNLPYLIKERVRIQKTKKIADHYLEQYLISKPVTFWGLKK
jgi:GT2 family glycosyltransferase